MIAMVMVILLAVDNDAPVNDGADDHQTWNYGGNAIGDGDPFVDTTILLSPTGKMSSSMMIISSEPPTILLPTIGCIGRCLRRTQLEPEPELPNIDNNKWQQPTTTTTTTRKQR